jgi:hypothetical protein
LFPQQPYATAKRTIYTNSCLYLGELRLVEVKWLSLGHN